jgi:hypothetical protein
VASEWVAIDDHRTGYRFAGGVDQRGPVPPMTCESLDEADVRDPLKLVARR